MIHGEVTQQAVRATGYICLVPLTADERAPHFVLGTHRDPADEASASPVMLFMT